MDILERYRDKKILIWGYGREGKSTESFFAAHPVAASVEISEAKPGEIDWSEYDYVFKSPGIRLEKPLREELPDLFADDPDSVCMTSQTELFIEAFRDRVIGITGTKGKSTTTSMLHHVLKKCLEAGAGDGRLKTAYLVGNIGVPCLDYYDEMTKGDALAVFELSCHQLAYAGISPHLAIFLNLYEDHLDFYGDRETYFRAKRHITDYQTEKDHLFIGKDVPPVYTKAQVTEVRESSGDGSEPMRLLGRHNRYNAEFVRRAATEVYGLPEEMVQQAVSEFPGLPHRLYYVGTVDDVRYYDDSISTIPEATIQAVESVPDVATVLVGGMDREIDYSRLREFIRKTPGVNYICMYASGQRVYEETLAAADSESDSQSESVPNLHYVPDLSAAVSLAREITPAGKSCVLSPAAASYGYFKNFEERGDRFRELLSC